MSCVRCLGIPKWQCHFGSSPSHLLGLIQSEHPADRAYILSCMHAADPEEPPALISWNKWWHITARTLLRAFQKRYWGRELLTDSEEREEPAPHASGKVLGSRTRPTAPAVEQRRPEVVAGKLLYPVSILWQIQQISILLQEGDAERKDLRPKLHCPDSRESVILNVDTPMTLPEKRKQRGRDLTQALQYPLRVACPTIMML